MDLGSILLFYSQVIQLLWNIVRIVHLQRESPNSLLFYYDIQKWLKKTYCENNF